MNVNIDFEGMKVSQTRKIQDVRVIAYEGNILTNDLKEALLQLASKVAYVDEHGQDYYDDLYDALYPPIPATSVVLSASTLNFFTLNTTQTLTATVYPSGSTDTLSWSSSDTSVATVSDGVVTAKAYGTATITATAGSVSATCSILVAQASVVSISAVYTQSGTVYDNASLDSLKSDLVVKAQWSDSSETTLQDSDYTLSGTLTVGTSTVTVSYGGKTTTFTVTVTASPTVTSITAVYTQSGTVYDTASLDSLKTDLVVTATYSDSSTETVPSSDYTLSGTLTEGTSTITVTYSGKTDTFTVTVTSLSILNQDVALTSSTQTILDPFPAYDTTETYSFVYTFAAHTPVSTATGNVNRLYGPITSNGGTRSGCLQYLNSTQQWRALLGGQGKNFTPSDGDVICIVHNFATQGTKIYQNGTQIYSGSEGSSFFADTAKFILQADTASITVAPVHVKVSIGDLH